MAPGVERLRRPRNLLTLTIVTLANYVWQIPYAIHQYGRSWTGLPRLSGLLILTLGWFLVAVWGLMRGHGWAARVLAAFLIVEAAFYLLHNVTGAFLHDLPAVNVVVLVASVLGYLNLVLALLALWLLARPSIGGDRDASRTPTDSGPGS